ncbi:MAG: hypothetical protein ABFS86_05380 [Planctomycetota bacterium]
MQMANLAQPPYETSLMGVVRGVFDHYGIEASTPWLYGATGHAFVVNIHVELCPSGPYCWNGDGWVRLLENLGVTRKAFGFFHAGSPSGERAKLEASVRDHLDRGVVCSHLNMDNQLISGYDDFGFTNCRPWGDCPVTPERLTYGSWDEFGEEIHVTFYAFERVAAVDERTQAKESLGYAADLWANPTNHTDEHYGMGPDGYANWLDAFDAGHGEHHGAWWNATVWSECRKMAAAYFSEISERFPDAADAALDLATRYGGIGDLLKRASDKEMAVDEKKVLVTQAFEAEREAVARIPMVLKGIG